MRSVDPRTPRAEMRAAYRALARRHHPDLAGGSHEKMAAPNNAWSVLSHPVARAEYDWDVCAGAEASGL